MWLLPYKCIYIRRYSCLLISDVHLGKVSHFRKNGIGIPGEVITDNFLRLRKVIKEVWPKKVIFLGDLFHSSFNREWHRFESLVEEFSKVSFELVMGNHDILDRKILVQALDLIHEQDCQLGPFLLTHDPQPGSGLYNLCGHIHPAIRIKGVGLQSERLPCFYFSEDYGILPAFGSFTGAHTLTPSKKDSVYIIAENEVIQV